MGIIGICGWGGMDLFITSIDNWIKATVAFTMYDISRVRAYGYFDKINCDERYKNRKNL